MLFFALIAAMMVCTAKNIATGYYLPLKRQIIIDIILNIFSIFLIIFVDSTVKQWYILYEDLNVIPYKWDNIEPFQSKESGVNMKKSGNSMKKALFSLAAIAIIAFAFIPLSCGGKGLAPYVDGNYRYYDYDRDGQYDYWFYCDDNGNYVGEGYIEDWPYNGGNPGTNNNNTGTNNNNTGTNNNNTGTNNNNTGTSGPPPSANGSVTTYPFPNSYPKFSGITMTAGGNNIDLYSVRVNNAHAWNTNVENSRTETPVGMFDMTGTVEVKVTVSAGITANNAKVRPVSENYGLSINGNTATFVLPKTGQYSFEYSANPNSAVLIFASPVEAAPSGVSRTFAGGQIHNIGNKENISGTVYLAPGAVVRGGFVLASGTKLVGRGIIDGRDKQGWLHNGHNAILPIETYGASNIEIKGISIFDPNAWCVQLQNSNNITLDNVKIISSRNNSDGISIQSSGNITIRNSFIRTWDDGVVIKNYGQQDSNNVRVNNTVFWTDLAQSMEIGVETNKGSKSNPRIYDCTFQDIVVFHALHKAPISIHNGDNAAVTNITWRNVVIENYNPREWNFLVDITNLTGAAMGGDASWTTVSARGSITGITIENVSTISGSNPGGRFDASGGGSINVTMKNIYNKGTKLNSLGTPKSATVNWQ